MKIRAALAALAVSATIMSGAAAPAHAETTWPCGHFELCTYTVRTAPLYRYNDARGTINYYLPRHTVVYIDCWIGGSGSNGEYIVMYSASANGYGAGWVKGADVDTGHDPNPNVGFCS